MALRTAGIALAMAILSAGPLAAKGTTVKLVITAPELTAPIDVTSAPALASVWGDEFVGPSSATPPKMLRRYLVSFHVVPPRESSARVMYVVQYTRDPFSGQGFVYLPGRDDEWGRVNRHTMGRDGQDGKWHRAPKAWSDAVAAALR